MDYAYKRMGFLVICWNPLAPLLLQNSWMHATFLQKVIICAVAGFLAAALLEWGKVFVEGADDALNGGYQNRAHDLVVKP